MNRTVKASTFLLLGAIVAAGSVGGASAMTGALSGSAASVHGIAQTSALPKVEVRGGIRYQELQEARDGIGDAADRGVWQAEADLYGVDRPDFARRSF